MEITVDTKKDSKDELRKLAQFLLSLSDGSSVKINQPSRNIFEDSTPAITPTTETTESATNAFAGMFGDDSTTESPSSGLQTFDVHSMLEEEKKEEAPKIVPY